MMKPFGLTVVLVAIFMIACVNAVEVERNYLKKLAKETVCAPAKTVADDIRNGEYEKDSSLSKAIFAAYDEAVRAKKAVPELDRVVVRFRSECWPAKVERVVVWIPKPQNIWSTFIRRLATE